MQNCAAYFRTLLIEWAVSNNEETLSAVKMVCFRILDIFSFHAREQSTSKCFKLHLVCQSTSELLTCFYLDLFTGKNAAGDSGSFRNICHKDERAWHVLLIFHSYIWCLTQATRATVCHWYLLVKLYSCRTKIEHQYECTSNTCW